MQTTHPNDDMYADFFQVGGYKNFGGFSSYRGQKFSEIAQRGRNTKGFLANAFKPFTRVYDEIKQDFELTDMQINKLWGEHKSQGGKLSGFKGYISKVKESKVDEQIIKEKNTLPLVNNVDISDVDFQDKKMGVPIAYIGVGAVLLVGLTILIAKKI